MRSTATLGGGCYWCLDAFYKLIKGVEHVESGYAGGHITNPTTHQVYSGTTGHAEVVQLTFDPSSISFRELLEIFFVMHDPTTLNRQGHDVGEWYRSVIFYHDENQKTIAERVINEFAAPLYNDPIVTELTPFTNFYPADVDNQDFYSKNPNAGYCMVVIDPKIQKLRQRFAEKLKS